MDRMVGALVRLMAFVAKFASRIPGIEFSRWEPGAKLRILLLGYNGKRNTGADARVMCIANQLEQLFGADNIEVSVMTIDPEATRPYFGDRVTQVPIDTIFFIPTLRICSRSHMVLLVEGSTLKSKFANALTLYFCQAAGIMKAQGKPCVAYGSEAGAMDEFVRDAVRDLCSDVYFMARTESSLVVARELGLEGCLGTDTAWTFDAAAHESQARELLREGGWNGLSPLMGVAPINPFQWPVKASLSKLVRALATGDWSLQYQKWYFFSWSAERRAQFERYLDGLASAVVRRVRETGCLPVVIGMEAVDSSACEILRGLLHERLGHLAPMVLSRDVDAGPLAAILTSLDELVTSRYHAQVLAMPAAVPTVAVSMDERLENISREMGLSDHLLLSVDDPNLGTSVSMALEYLDAHREEVRSKMREYRASSLESFERMGEELIRLTCEAFPQMINVVASSDREAEGAHA